MTPQGRRETSAMPGKAYAKLAGLQRETAVLGSVDELVHWDQETYMPSGGAKLRSEQCALLSGLVHERATSKEVGDLLEQCLREEIPRDSIEAANVREWKRDYDRARKLPREHVEELSRTRSVAQHEWQKARAASDFSKFEPHLDRMINLMRKSAEYYGWPEGGEPYDALLEGYEPGATAAQIEQIFAPLRTRLSRLIHEIRAGGNRPDDSVHTREVPRRQQEAFVRFVATAIGFRFDDGRLDVSTHPFCSGLGPGDCRLTTRFRENNVMDALSSTMHEAGHGIYEQNLPAEAFGTPCGSAVSLGIHESQSRGWENIVGRSRSFWEWCLPHAKEFMPELLADQSVETVYAAQNIVEPSYIRVEADEATYNLHIMLRFEIERAMIRGELSARDVPREWNRRFKEYLGIEVDKDSNGCLQDVHWAFGLMGYFPTYTLGNLYACQFFEAAREQLGDLDAQFRRGEFEPLRKWLTENIHRHGRRYGASELCKRITGRELSADPLMRHLEGKLKPIYGLA